jgi:hypothetical protein
MSGTNNWDDIEPHIKRHESGCWTWDGSPVEGVFRIVAEALGASLPSRNGKYYRMPDCTVGKKCVNPNHIGTIEDYWRTLDGRRQDIPEPCETSTGMKLTPRDKRFLKSLNIGWE